MGHRIENNCVGCEHCINCGQREEEVYFCDECGDYGDMYTPLFRTDDGRELCWECYKETLIEKACDDMDDTICSACGREADFLYQKDGEWYCEECLERITEKVEME